MLQQQEAQSAYTRKSSISGETMAGDYNSGSSTVNNTSALSVINFTVPSLTQTMKNTGRITGTGAVQTLFTAAAGKTAYVYGIVLTSTAAGGYNILDNASANIMDIDNPSNASTTALFSSTPFLKVAAGESLKGSGANTNFVTVFYWEE